MAVLLMMPGCASLNTYVRDFNIVPVSQELEIGKQMSAEVAKQMTVLPATSAESKKVEAMGQKLVADLPRKEFNYHFAVVKDDTPNAFTLPGGYIYVHTGTIKFSDNDDMLAGVIAHEIGHAYDRHPAKGLSREYGVSFLENMLLKNNQNQIKNLTLKVANQGILTKYGRDDENEADEIAYYLLRKSGYSEDGLLLFFKKLVKIQGSGGIPFLSTHPPTSERIARVEQLKAAGVAKITTASAGAK